MMRNCQTALTSLTRRKGPLAAFLFLSLPTFLVISFLWATNSTDQPKRPWYYRPSPCRLPKPFLRDLTQLALSMHSALDSVHVPHVLCYGTLWGALRIGRVLPWDTNVDMCALDSHFAKVSPSQLTEAFAKKGLVLTYNWRRGVYEVTFRRGDNSLKVQGVSVVSLSDGGRNVQPHIDPQTKTQARGGSKSLILERSSNVAYGHGDTKAQTHFPTQAQGFIHVFTNSTMSSDNLMPLAVPGGWVAKVWRWFGQQQVSFPVWLLTSPFKEEPFAGQDLPVPHDGLELLKFLYPQDWWLEAKPPGCI